MWILLKLLLIGLRLAPTARRDLILENLALGHQLAVCARPRRPHLREADWRFWSSLARGWPAWRHALVLVQPETVVAWHRTAWRRYWTCKSRRRSPGRPRVSLEVQALIRRLASENPRCERFASSVSFVHSASMSVHHRFAPTAARPCDDHRLPAGEPSSASTPTRSGLQTSYRSYADFPDPLCLLRSCPRSAPHRALQRHRAPDGRLGLAADHPGHALGNSAALPHS